ncbi:hypothetical protein KKD62_00620 [Patescibacteria group bacterium]|nr:hypothetical protein [Patescibacteria group bacterium]MBU1931438.1 hypothetical protein [Patescibacteria group bacterium]
MKNNIVILLIIAVLLAGGAGFFGGMKYQQSKQPSRADFQSLGQSRGGLRQPGMPGMQQRESSGMIRGEIINQDEETITVKLPDDSSKIILISENTTINKTTAGSVDDLETGKQVMVFGQENSDKSISASNIQLDFGLGEGIQEH